MLIDLNDIIECIEHEGELLTHYYNKETGVIIYITAEKESEYKASDINRLDDFEDWQQEIILMISDFEKNPEKYIQLPTIKELDEYEIMLTFITDFLEDEEAKAKLIECTKDKNPYRKVREGMENLGLLNDWYDYREAAEEAIAINWCDENNIEYEA